MLDFHTLEGVCLSQETNQPVEKVLSKPIIKKIPLGVLIIEEAVQIDPGTTPSPPWGQAHDAKVCFAKKVCRIDS